MPKGVVITHSNVLSFVAWGTRYFEMRPGDRNSGHSPLHFDLSTFDIYGTLSTGGELYLVPPEANLLPNKLAQFIRDNELTQWFSVPSALNYIAKFDLVGQQDFPSLKRLIWCGEVFPTAPLIYWMERLPHVAFTNLYGPTEATIASSYYTVPATPADAREPVPIGRPCDGEDLLVLDASLKRVAPGQIGDLYIQGVGLSLGYWRDAERTAEVFVNDPAVAHDGAAAQAPRIYKTGDLAKVDQDGLFHYIGRADSQIKSRGYRIELGEIETALSTVAEIKESAVVAIDSEGAQPTAPQVPVRRILDRRRHQGKDPRTVAVQVATVVGRDNAIAPAPIGVPFQIDTEIELGCLRASQVARAEHRTAGRLRVVIGVPGSRPSAELQRCPRSHRYLEPALEVCLPEPVVADVPFLLIPIEAQVVVAIAGRSRHRGVAPQQAVAATLDGGSHLWLRRGAAPGNDVDDPRQRGRAIEVGQGASRHLDALNAGDGQAR